MTNAVRQDITELLQRVNEGREGAMSALLSAVNDELRVLARRHMEREFGTGLPGVTLQATALVNETYLRLIKQRTKYDNRGHFFAIATRVLIRVLRDYQRARSAAKRGGGRLRVTLDLEAIPSAAGSASGTGGVPVEELVQSLEKLEALDPRKAEVVKLRVLWGLSIVEAAEAIGVGHTTVERDWQFARAWLKKELKEISTKV